MKSDNIISVSSGKAIKFWRKIKLIDQQKLSEFLGSSRSYVAKLENGHVGISFKKILEIADVLDVDYLSLICCPDEQAVEILKDIYNDDELDVSKHELEILWNQSLFRGRETLDNYVKTLDLYRSESSTKKEAQLVVARDDEPKEKAYYQIRMEKKANKG